MVLCANASSSSVECGIETEVCRSGYEQCIATRVDVCGESRQFLTENISSVPLLVDSQSNSTRFGVCVEKSWTLSGLLQTTEVSSVDYVVTSAMGTEIDDTGLMCDHLPDRVPKLSYRLVRKLDVERLSFTYLEWESWERCESDSIDRNRHCFVHFD